MLDIEGLLREWEGAAVDKADLFDFYHRSWPGLVEELRRLQSRELELIERAMDLLEGDA